LEIGGSKKTRPKGGAQQAAPYDGNDGWTRVIRTLAPGDTVGAIEGVGEFADEEDQGGGLRE